MEHMNRQPEVRWYTARGGITPGICEECGKASDVFAMSYSGMVMARKDARAEINTCPECADRLIGDDATVSERMVVWARFWAYRRAAQKAASETFHWLYYSDEAKPFRIDYERRNWHAPGEWWSFWRWNSSGTVGNRPVTHGKPYQVMTFCRRDGTGWGFKIGGNGIDKPVWGEHDGKWCHKFVGANPVEIWGDTYPDPQAAKRASCEMLETLETWPDVSEAQLAAIKAKFSTLEHGIGLESSGLPHVNCATASLADWKAAGMPEFAGVTP